MFAIVIINKTKERNFFPDIVKVVRAFSGNRGYLSKWRYFFKKKTGYGRKFQTIFLTLFFTYL